MLVWLSSPPKIFFLCLLLAVLYMIWPYFPYILMGAVLSVLSYPLLRRFRRLGLDQLWAAVLTTFLNTVILFLPIFFLLFVGAKTAAEQLPFLVAEVNPQLFQSFMNRPELTKIERFLQKTLNVDSERLKDYVVELTQHLGQYMARGFGTVVTQIPSITLSLFIMLLSLLYFLHMGPAIRGFFDKRHSIPQATLNLLQKKFIAISNSLVLAALLIAVLQSLVFSLACLALGLNNISIIALIVFLLSFIPVFGSAPFTFAMVLYYFAMGSNTQGFALLAAAIIVVSLDNFIRPIILRQGASMNPLVAILAILGGVRVFGFAGIFLGPLLVGLLQESFQVFEENSEVTS